jgi:hypothetical protein
LSQAAHDLIVAQQCTRSQFLHSTIMQSPAQRGKYETYRTIHVSSATMQFPMKAPPPDLSSRAADSRWRVQRGNDPALCTGKKRLGAAFKPCFGLSGIPLAQTDRSHCVIPTVAYPDFLLCVTNDVYVCGSRKRNKARFTPPAGRRRRWRLRRNKFSLHVWEGRKGHESPGAPSPRISCRGLLALANFMRLSLELSRVLPTHGT